MSILLVVEVVSKICVNRFQLFIHITLRIVSEVLECKPMTCLLNSECQVSSSTIFMEVAVDKGNMQVWGR